MADEVKNLGKIGVSPDGKVWLREPIFINLTTFKNVQYLDIRKHYEKDDTWNPTTKGITVNKEQFLELIEILEKNKDEITKWFDKEEEK